jgi:hypothetical protein
MAIVLSLISYGVYALPEESLTLDPISGNYTVVYYGSGRLGHKPLRSVVYVPSTKVAPRIDVSTLLGKNFVTYVYTISNEKKGKQSIGAVIFDPVADIASKVGLPKQYRDIDPNTIAQVEQMGGESLITPMGWVGRATTSRDGGLRIGWSYEKLVSDQDGLQAGTTQGGFGFFSRHIPGLGVAQIIGNAEVTEWPDEGPTGAIGEQLAKLIQNDFVPINVAVPTIAVPVPFDAALLLDRIRTHVATWTSKQLLDPALATQLDRYLVSAADAYRRNQFKAGKEHIETLREMLKLEHKDLDHDDDENENSKRGEKNDDHRAASQRILIDRLAARILDFDLKYVLKRTEHEDDDHKKH